MKAFETVFSAKGVRVNRMVLGPGEEVPWHFHTTVLDTFYVLRGTATIFTHKPKSTVVLRAGETFQTRPRQPHRTLNASQHDVAVLVIQGMGKYDFKALAAQQGAPADRPRAARSAGG